MTIALPGGQVVIPEGWDLKPAGSMPDTFVLHHPDRLMATIDLDRRTIRSGWAFSGPTLGERGGKRPTYGGRGWCQKMVDAAILHLAEVAL